MCINPQNPTVMGVLPPISVDNHVENVDFCIAHALYMQRTVCSFNRKFVTKFCAIKNVGPSCPSPKTNI